MIIFDLSDMLYYYMIISVNRVINMAHNVKIGNDSHNNTRSNLVLSKSCITLK